MRVRKSHRTIRPVLAFAFFLGMAGVIGIGPAEADTVPVRAADHPGFGRMVFDWPSAVGYSAAVEGGRLVVRFQRPIEANLATVSRALAKYVGEAKVEEGNAVVLGLKGEFGLRHFISGSSIVVDVLEAAPQAAAGNTAAASAPATANLPAAAPAQAAAATPPAEAPTVAIRTGEHPDYTRIVFDWPSRVGYRLERSGTTATLRFDKPARLNIGNLRARPPKFIGDVGTTVADGATIFNFTVPDSSVLNHFLSENSKVVLDIKAPAPGAAPQPATASANPAPAAAPAAAPASPVPAAPASAPTAAATPTSAPEVVPPQQAAAPAPAPAPAAPAPAAPMGLNAFAETPAAPKTEQALSEAAPSNAPMSLVSASPPAPTPVSQPATQAPGPVGPQTPALVRDVSATPVQGGGIAVRFDWKEPTAAAVFRRAGALWVIFDKNLAVDLEKLKAAGGNVIRNIERVPVNNATALRIDTVAGINPELKRNGLAWILEFSRRAIAPTTPIEVNPQTNSPVGARVFMPVNEPGNAIAVVDPDVKDTLVVVPVVQLGQGLGQLRDYPQFSLLPTAQGVVVKPKIDDLRVRSLPQGIELSSVSRLHISPVTAELAASANVAPVRPLTRFMELERDGRENINEMARARQRLQLEVAKAQGPARERARQRLARYYFANGLFPESRGVMEAMANERPEIVADSEFIGMRGAASTLMGHFKEAHDDLDRGLLEDNDEGEFWRAVLTAAEGDLVKPAGVFKRLGGLLRPYPKGVKMPVGLLMVDSSIAVGDVGQAQRFLALLNAEQASPTQKAQISFLTGKLKAVAGDFNGAVASWDQVLTSKHRPSLVKAMVGRDELMLRLGTRSRAEVIEDYDKLRYIWRGDEFEFILLRRLGRLQLENADYREGLRTLRQAATYFRGHPEVGQVTQLMAESFANIMLGEAMDNMPALSAVALYEEFKELTPAGARGDLVIRRLADKLASIELYDRAAAFLEDQVQYRLKGVEKAQVGTRLAVIYFLDRKLPKAMETLTKTEESGMPDELQKARRLLRARILYEQQKGSDALALLKDDKSSEADLMRLEIYWNTKDWTNSSLMLRRLVEASNAQPEKPLDERQTSYVLNLAIALTLAGNQRGVNLLRRDFGAAMNDTPSKDAFQLIASPETQGLLDYRTVAEKVQSAEKFQGFMSSYRKRLQDQFKTSVQ
jgi:hypothetical protein